jgi:indolepyruvate ferredoxin oxidoreductase beta subunit
MVMKGSMDIKRLVIVAVGGQGNLLASSVLGGRSAAGVPMRKSEILAWPSAGCGGIGPDFPEMLSTIISDGETDVLMGFERRNPRALGKCLRAPW